ncbi:hypothetical protein BHE74_00027337 [Ensete ventricosum]|nr:hypothetical protein BHE74_00027337 [Ensete ventricosum]RZS08039.1 hypothetical protein BHM03_00038965 [Ensete ventricosum]
MDIEEPLLSSPATTTTTSSSSSSADEIGINTAASTLTILARLTMLLTLVAISLWANHEASMNIDISIVNSAVGSRAGRRFDLNFVSNGRANRIVHHASRFVEQALYPEEAYPRKPISHIILHLASNDLDSVTSVSPGAGSGDYTIHLSPSLMSAADGDDALASEVHRAVARLRLWDAQQAAPSPLLEAVADYLAVAAGFFPQSSNKTCNVSSYWSAEFLQYCEGRRNGFIARLNRGMRERWSESTVDDALGSPVRQVYTAFHEPETGYVMESVNSTSSSAEVRQEAMRAKERRL